ncbi:hypothetical protein DL93DRAFT_141592 [Clavulina sp. PMI_390]|nr:hypothetical protein DL93DRAFT_141592 [Clavulina sp. PMI_390]
MSSQSLLPKDGCWDTPLGYLPFDVFERIILMLDLSSLFQLASTSKHLFDTIIKDSLLWNQILRNYCAEHCLAPHSFSHSIFASPRAVRNVLSRSHRIVAAILDQDRSLRCQPSTYKLDLEPGLRDHHRRMQHVDGMLLPGGRWYASLVAASKTASNDPGMNMQIICWDLLASVNGVLVPSARLALELPTGRAASIRSLMKAHLCEGKDSVIIACASFPAEILHSYVARGE